MAHPAPFDCVITHNSAMTSLSVEYKGKAAHAAAFPWEGVNALDAAVLAYTNISLLRQQMKPTWRAHAIFTNGGTKPPRKLHCVIISELLTSVSLGNFKEKWLIVLRRQPMHG